MDVRRSSAAVQFKRLFEYGSFSGYTDGQLLERFLNGAGEEANGAFEALMIRHGPMVLRVCRAVLKESHDAEDAFQATFLILILRGESIHKPHSLASWLHGTAARVSKSARGMRAKRRIRECRAAQMTSPTHESRTETESSSMIHEELAHLPDRYRLPLVLFDLEGHSYESTAALLGWPIGTVKSRLSRGRERLRVRLMRRGIGPDGTRLAMGTLLGQLPKPHATLQAGTVRLAVGYLRGSVNIDGSPRFVGVLVRRFIAGYGTTKAAMIGLALTCGMAAAGTALGVLTQYRGTNHSASSVGRLVETSLAKEQFVEGETAPRLPASLTRPRPWETVVRLRIWNNKEKWRVSFCTGAIVESDEESTLVATCAHNFRPPSGQGLPQIKDGDISIRVDLFDGRLVEKGRGLGVTATAESLDAELVDADYQSDVALVRVHPGRRLPASRIASSDREVKAGDSLVTVGCSAGDDPTAWQTEVTNPKIRGIMDGRTNYEAIECRPAPMQGRSGGGLFTQEGELVGICNYANYQENTGIYASIKAIQQLLDRSVKKVSRTAKSQSFIGIKSVYIPILRIDGMSRADSLLLTQAIQDQLAKFTQVQIVGEPAQADRVLEIKGELRRP